MPRYLVTLRHTETGETIRRVVEAEDTDDAFGIAEGLREDNYDAQDRFHRVWGAEYAEPAPDPFRDR